MTAGVGVEPRRARGHSAGRRRGGGGSGGRLGGEASPRQLPEDVDATPPRLFPEGVDATPPRLFPEGVDATPPRLFPEGLDAMPPPLFSDAGDAMPPETALRPNDPRMPATPPAPDDAPSGERRDDATLEQLICGLWDEVLSEGRAACPVCGGEMVGRASAHARATEGRCGDCGTTIG